VSIYIKTTLNKNKAKSLLHKHNHVSDQSNIETVKSKAEIKEIANVSGSTHNRIFNEIMKKRTGWASLCYPVRDGVHLVYRIGHYNRFVKFECNDRYHCIWITILNGDGLLDIYRIYILLLLLLLLLLLYYNNLVYRKQSSNNFLFGYNFFINILYNYI
jgi:hypothetical protein